MSDDKLPGLPPGSVCGNPPAPSDPPKPNPPVVEQPCDPRAALGCIGFMLVIAYMILETFGKGHPK